MAEAKDKFHNISFYDLLEKLKGVSYAYSIDKDKENGVYELSIHSTSLSELDDEDLEEGTIGSFSYMKKMEIYEDIQMATDIYGINLEEI